MKRSIELIRNRFHVDGDLAALSRADLEAYCRELETFAVEQQGKRREVEAQRNKIAMSYYQLDAETKGDK